ncbi:GNAT family N-acetyltransferase [Candidatus Uabimicrobium sp. HlEnr_7]|uniref:GNAT family N-acetyltransferase n=1 Tax=Candidatus Uabimicrobium helgolandensis TaxID=3095367 RepID=UPI003558DB75
MIIDVKAVGIECFDLLLPYIRKLLDELGEEGDEIEEFDISRIRKAWKESQGAVAFIAYTENNKIVGIMTVVQAFAVYANGNYGIINEMYVESQYRSHGVGRMLIESVIAWGKSKGWSRIDVTAPESTKWKRTQQFYERQGFAFSGPKLKIIL